MIYPYHCESCDARFDVSKPVSESAEAEPCPICGALVREQDYQAKRLGGFVSEERSWSQGRLITQLPPWHPDYRVTNRREMENVYKRNGICMDTGQFVSTEAQVKATVRPEQQNGTPEVVSGVRKS